jgi:iron(III) transport system substrate-binding protein
MTTTGAARTGPPRGWRSGRLAAALAIAVALAATACNLRLPGPGADSGPVPTATAKPPARPTSTPLPAVRAWHDGALREGTLRVYADLSPRETADLSALLARRYPDLSVDWTTGLDRELLSTVLAEARDGGPSFDVFVGDAGTLLKGAGLAERWSPPEAVALRPGYVDPDGAWHALAATYHVLQYHTEQVPPQLRPASYEALADPYFLGRLVAEDEPLAWLHGLIEVRGRQPTLDTLAGLSPQGVVRRRGPRLVADLVSAGQYAVAIANRLDAVERSKRGGAKTDWIAIEPVVVQPTVAVVAARTPRPNAARLFANFLLSADAQAALAVLGRIPTRQDVDPEPQNLVRGIATHFTIPPEGDAERDLRAVYDGLWR